MNRLEPRLDVPPAPPAYERRQSVAAITMAGYNVRYLGRLYRTFSGDLLLPLVLGEIGLHALRSLEGAPLHPVAHLEDAIWQRLARRAQEACRPAAVGNATGVPRETVRRKIFKLVALGLIEHAATDEVIVTDRAVQYFGYDFNLDTVRDFLDTASRLRGLLDPAAANAGRWHWQHREAGFAAAVPRPVSEVPARYRERRMLVAALISFYSARHLKRLYRAFSGDLLLPLLLGEIAFFNASRVLAHPFPDADAAEEALRHAALRREFQGCNTYSIAETTGVPRETARRKIAMLVRHGWVERAQDGTLAVTPKPLLEFGPGLSADAVRDFLDTFAKLEVALELG